MLEILKSVFFQTPLALLGYIALRIDNPLFQMKKFNHVIADYSQIDFRKEVNFRKLFRHLYLDH